MSRYKTKCFSVVAIQYDGSIDSVNSIRDNILRKLDGIDFHVCREGFLNVSIGGKSCMGSPGIYFVLNEHENTLQTMTPDRLLERFELAPQNHIERMEVEASELQAKIDGAQKFLDSFQEEDAPLICDEQFDLIEKQLKFMKAYLITLRRRIEFDKEMFNAIGVKD